MRLFTKDGEWHKGVLNARKRLHNLASDVMSVGKVLTAAGGAVVGPILGAAKLFTDVGDAIGDAAARTGLLIRDVQTLGFAAEQSGADFETLETGIKTMQKQLHAAATGGKGAVELLAEIGIKLEDIQSLNPAEQFRMIADRIGAVNDPAKRTALALEMFGKSGQKLVPLLSAGRAGIMALEKEAESLGIVLSTEAVAAAQEFDDASKKMWVTLKAVGVQIGAAVIPALTDYANGVTAAIPPVIDWIKSHQDLIVTAMNVAGVVVGVGGSLIGLAVIINQVSSALKTLANVMDFTAKNGSALGKIGLVAFLIALTAAAFRAFGELDRMNRELKRTAELTKQLQTREEKQLAATIAQGDALTDPAERDKFFADQIEMKKRNLQGQWKAKEDAQAAVNEQSNFWTELGADVTGGHHTLSVAKRDLEEQQERFRQMEGELKQLEEARKKAASAGGNNLPGGDSALIPQEMFPDAVPDSDLPGADLPGADGLPHFELPRMPDLNRTINSLDQVRRSSPQSSPNTALALGSSEAMRAILAATSPGAKPLEQKMVDELKTANEIAEEQLAAQQAIGRGLKGGANVQVGRVA